MRPSKKTKKIVFANVALVTLFFFINSLRAYGQLKTRGEDGKIDFIRRALVRIQASGGNGSGTIVGLIKGRVVILTSKHVVKGTARSEEIGIYNWEGKEIGRAIGSEVKSSANSDISFIVAERLGKACIVPATFGETSKKVLSQIDQGTAITVAGFASTDSNLTRKPALRFSNGTVTSILPEEEAINGYQFSYSSPTARGMSGGGVFVWSNGLVLIGTHGSGERDEMRGFAKTGFNYAVPANKAYDLMESSFRSQPSLARIDIRQKGNISISRTLKAICSDPFEKWFCTLVGNNQTGANDQACFSGTGDRRKKIIVKEGQLWTPPW